MWEVICHAFGLCPDCHTHISLIGFFTEGFFAQVAVLGLLGLNCVLAAPARVWRRIKGKR